MSPPSTSNAVITQVAAATAMPTAASAALICMPSGISAVRVARIRPLTYANLRLRRYAPL